MNCPVDRTVQLVTISIEGVSIERCGKCNGHWLQAGELAKLAVRDDSIEPVVSFSRDSERICPEDGSPLTEVEFPVQSGLKIDVCSQCKGIWLDAYELGQALTLLGRHPEPSGNHSPNRSVLDLLVRLSHKRQS